MADDSSRPIIIKKVVAHGGGHNGGAWKVAYADFVTAMMALFIVLWLMSASKPVQEAVGGYFRDPSGHDKKAGNPTQGGPTKAEDLEHSKAENMEKLKQEIQKRIEDMKELQKLKGQIEMTVTTEGLRIDLVENAKGIFFATGSAIPSDNCKVLLRMLAEEFQKLPNKISIEGHTDSQPYSADAVYTNWELSTDRANAARRFVRANGVHDGQISQVRGYADQNLRHPEKPDDPSNRRISFVIHYLTAPVDVTGQKNEGSGSTGESVKTAAVQSSAPAASGKK